MLNAGVLQVTGRGTNVNFTIDDRAPFDKVMAGLETFLSDNRHLFSSGMVTVNVGRRILAREQLARIKQTLETESGLTVAQFWCSPEVLGEALADAGYGMESPAPVPTDAIQPETLVQVTPELETASGDLGDILDFQADFGFSSLLTEEEFQEADTQLEDGATEVSEEEVNVGPVEFTPEELAGSFAEASSLLDEFFKDNDVSGDSSAESEQKQEDEVSFWNLLPQPRIKESEELEDSPELIDEASFDDEVSIEPVIDPSPLELAVLGLEQTIAEVGVEPGELTVPVVERPTAEPGGDFDEESPDAEKSTEPIVAVGPTKNRAALNRENEALLIKTTCRSGEVIRYPGDVVILADVNPGAQIIADGDILVFGSLRGLAHAGAGGDIQATIIALNLDASRIQIGPYIGMAPRSRKKSKSNRAGPSLVFVRRQHIYVAPYKGRFAGYSGGTLYDG